RPVCPENKLRVPRHADCPGDRRSDEHWQERDAFRPISMRFFSGCALDGVGDAALPTVRMDRPARTIRKAQLGRSNQPPNRSAEGIEAHRSRRMLLRTVHAPWSVIGIVDLLAPECRHKKDQASARQ